MTTGETQKTWIERLRPGTWMMAMGALLAVFGLILGGMGGSMFLLFIGLAVIALGYIRRAIAMGPQKR